MKCPYCGAEVSSEVNYCSVCGVPVIKVPQKAASTAQKPSG
jgi:predicted amidophosphoribosyltransferase